MGVEEGGCWTWCELFKVGFAKGVFEVHGAFPQGRFCGVKNAFLDVPRALLGEGRAYVVSTLRWVPT